MSQRIADRMARRSAPRLPPFALALPGTVGAGVCLGMLELTERDYLRQFPEGLLFAVTYVGTASLALSFACFVMACWRPRERWLALLMNGSFFLLLALLIREGAR